MEGVFSNHETSISQSITCYEGILTNKFKGVCWCHLSKNWIAKIGLGGKEKTIGRFETEEKAAKAYNQWAKFLFGEYATLNKV